MHFLRTVKHLFQFLYRYSTLLVNLLLLCALGIQSLVLLTEVNNRQFAIPDFIFRGINQVLEKKDLKLRASSKFLNLSGKLEFHDVGVYYKEAVDPVFNIQKLQVGIKLLSLLTGKINVKEVIAEDAKAFVPAVFSPTGTYESILEKVFFHASFNNSQINVKQLTGNLQSLDLLYSGFFDLNALSLNNDSVSLLQYFQQLGVVYEKLQFLQNFRNPTLNITSSRINSSSFVFSFLLGFDFFQYNDELKLNDVVVRSFATLSDNKFVIDNHLMIDVKSLAWGDRLVTQRASFIIEDPKFTADFSNIQYPSHVYAILTNASWLKQDHVSLRSEVDFTQAPKIQSRSYISKKNDWINLDFSLNTALKQVSFVSLGRSDVDTLETYIPSSVKDSEEYPALAGVFNFKASGLLDYGATKDKIKDCQLKLWSTDLVLNNTPFSNVYLESHLYPERIDVTHAFVENEDTIVQGSYSKRFASGLSRYLLTGKMNPKHFDYWMGDWWQNLWNDIQLNAENPCTNIDISILPTKTDSSLSYVFADITAEQFLYKKLPIKSTQLILDSGPTWLHFQNVVAHSPNGSITADVYRTFDDSPESNLLRTQVKAKSTLPLEYLDVLIDEPEAHAILKRFDCYSPPTVSIEGTKFANDEQDKFKIQFNNLLPLYYDNLFLDSLNFSVDYSKLLTFVSDIRFGFSQGQGTANLVLSNQYDRKNHFSFSFNLDQAQQDLAAKYAKAFFQKQKINAQSQDSLNGELFAQGRITGFFEDLDSYSGLGKFHVTNADFGKIHLFGFISKIFSATPFGLGSFQLTDAESSFQIKNGFVLFPDLNIYGPSMNIKSEGNISLNSQEIDFIMDIDPLGRGKRPLLSQAFLILSPITQSIQVKLGGTVQNPQWHANLTPLGLFKQKGLKPKEDKQ